MTRGFALVTGLVGLGVVVGWWLDVPMLRNGLGSRAVNPLTAVMFLLSAVSIAISSLEHAAPALRRLGTACGGLVLLIAALKLAAPLIGLAPAFDQILFRAEWAALGSEAPKPLTAGSAMIYLMIGTALLLTRAGREAWRLLSRSIGLFLLLIVILALFAVVYRWVAGAGASGSSSGLGMLLGFTALSVAMTIAGPSKTGPGHKESDILALRGKVNVAVVVAVAILILTGALSIWSASRSRNADRLQADSYARRAQVLRLLSSLQDAETGERGFLLTGDPEFLGLYFAAVDSLPGIIRRTVALVGAWEPHAGRLEALQPLVDQKVALLAEVIRLQESRRTAEAIAMIRTGRGKAVMDEIRRHIAGIVSVESSLDAQLGERVLRDDRIALTTNVIAALLAVCFLILAGLAINQDLRKRALAELALRQNEGRLSQIVDLIPHMIFLKEPRELRFVRFNKAGEELLGYSRESLLGKNDFDFFPETDARLFTARDRQVLASHEVVDIPEETVHTRTNGVRVLHTKKVAVRDEQDRPLFLLGISEDITERKRLEEERDRFFTLSLDMLCIAKSDGYFKRLNPAFTQTLGWSMEEMLARPFLDFVHPDDHAATVREVERQTRSGEEVLHFENRYRHKDGSWRLLSWKSVPQPDGLMFATARDVTELRQTEAAMRQAAEAAEAANRAKSDFLAKMSHELRTPLNSIIGFSEILEDGGAGTLNEKQQRYVANVLLSGRNLLQLINDILDLSKVEAGRMELAPSEFDVRAALEQVRAIVATLADKKGLSVQLDVAADLPLLCADQAKFKQIMYNLLGNAIKFTPESGRVDLTARLVRPSGNGSTTELEVAVADTGIGIPPEDLARIFNEFEQVNNGSHRGQEGTGLGLALTRKLVELHGGRVWVESVVGQGSVFRFTIPYPVGRAEVAWSATSPLEIAAVDQSGPLVLIIDNDRGARDLISHHLTESGYRVQTAANGEEAFRLAQALRPDAITLDMLLPDRDGLVILALLKNNPDTCGIPVVVVSITDRRELGFSLGATDWLVKPIQKGALIAALERTIRRPAAGFRPTVLVVDDEPATVEYLSELLQQRGFAVLAAPGGRAGIDLAVSANPDLILLDLMMPEVNGFDVVRALRENLRTRPIPIVILTAMDLTQVDAKRLGNSVEAVIAKGGPEHLLAELARICPVVSPAPAAVPAERL